MPYAICMQVYVYVFKCCYIYSSVCYMHASVCYMYSSVYTYSLHDPICFFALESQSINDARICPPLRLDIATDAVPIGKWSDEIDA